MQFPLTPEVGVTMYLAVWVTFVGLTNEPDINV